MINKLKSQNGITGIDLSVSIIIIMLFVSIIATVSMQVSTSLTSQRKLEIATNCMTEIMEKVDEMDYDNIEEIADYVEINIEDVYPEGSLRKEIQTILSQKDENNKNKYGALEKIELKVEQYEPENYTPEIEGDEPPDLVKKVTLRITYELNNKAENFEVSRLKTRYNVKLEE